jgi:hypothetical protein
MRDMKLVSSRQFKRGKLWVKEITVSAEDKKKGMSAGEILDILLQVPGDVVPKFMVRIPGQVREIKYEVTMVLDEGK